MSKYIVRNIGWVFNDSTYESDGEYKIVEVFHDLEGDMVAFYLLQLCFIPSHLQGLLFLTLLHVPIGGV